jgi:predicted nucleotidyltransferase
VEALANLAGVFECHEQVKLVYLFGSRSAGASGPLSDWDFAVYLDERDPKRIFDIRLALLDAIQRGLGTDHVDVVILNQVESPEFKYNVIASGELIYEREPFKLLVEPRILNEYFDFRDMLRRHGLTGA